MEKVYIKGDEERLAYAKKLLDDFVANGGDLGKLTAKSELYKKINGLRVKHSTEDRLMTFGEKLAYCGYVKQPKVNVYADDVEKYLTREKEKLIQVIKPFVLSGGNVNKIKTTDEIYNKVAHIRTRHTDGKPYTIAEKFALAGYPLTRGQGERSLSAEELLRESIDKYINSGGKLNTTIPNYPFVLSVRHCVKVKRKETNNPDLTAEEYLLGLGYDFHFNAENYYKRYYKMLSMLEKHKDKAGFVDSYLSERTIYTLVGNFAEKFDMPRDVVVGLVANQNKKAYTLLTDYFKEAQYLLKQYKEKYGSYEGISTNDKNLTSKLFYIIQLCGNAESNLEDVVQFLTEDESVKIKKRSKKENIDIKEVVLKLKAKADANGGRLLPQDLTWSDRLCMVREAYRNNISLADLFEVYNIRYEAGRVKERGSRMKVAEYPYMKEMREERDMAFKKYMSENPDSCKEIAFEQYITICKNIYDKYEPLILRTSEATTEEQINY